MVEGMVFDREERLRAWFTRDCDPLQRTVDGLDLGWGGVQRWATARMPAIKGPHLDIACGYATFLAQLGWRFPAVQLVGVNIDFEGPQAMARPLLAQAGVPAAQVQADARRLSFLGSLQLDADATDPFCGGLSRSRATDSEPRFDSLTACLIQVLPVLQAAHIIRQPRTAGEAIWVVVWCALYGRELDTFDD